MTLVALDRLSKRFPSGLEALRDISFNLEPGSFTAILGPSGSGKSTLLRLLAGLTEPTGGAVRWLRAAPRLSVVFQEPTLMPWARILDNVALPRVLQGQAKEQAQAEAKMRLEQVGLGDFSRAYPGELSGGMKMRVALARALIATPDLLLLDEPFAALDEIGRSALNAELLTLWQKQRPAILFITHSIAEAVFLAERIHVLSPRPGQLAATLSVDLPYPRTEDDRLTPQFIDHVRRASAALKDAMAAA